MRMIFTLVLVAIACQALSQSTTITAIQDGYWNAGSTWSPSRVPTEGDVVLIPAGRTVNFKGTPYSQSDPSSRPQMRINIYGRLDFSDPGNDKLYLDNGSIIQVYNGGQIFTSTSSTEIIAIYTGSGTTDNLVWTGTPSTVSGPQFATSSSNAFSYGTLPIKLKSFTAQAKSNQVSLKWSTAEEINSHSFVIERSTNARSWSPIQTVAAKGQAADYSAIDDHPASGDNFYRLQSVDMDGKTEYSNVVKVSRGRSLAAYVSPNPASEQVTVSLSTATTEYLHLQLVSSNGQVVQEARYASGTTLIQFGLKGTTPGVYTLLLRNGNTTVEATQLLIQ